MPDIIMTVIEILGIIAFAVSGAMVAINKETDLFGVLFLAVITSFGGGITRDVLIGSVPRFFESYARLAIAVVAAFIVYLIASILKKKYVENEEIIANINNYFDAVGLGIFTVMGSKICIDAGVTSPIAIISLGMITGIGGGMIRDFSLKEIPFVLRKRIYAVASLIGGTLFYVLYILLDLPELVAIAIGFAVIFAIRILATVFKWNMPKAIIFNEIQDKDKK